MDDAVGIAFTAGLPFRGLRTFRPDPTLLAGFPPGWLTSRTLLPLTYTNNILTLATPTPLPDLSGLDPTLTITLVLSPAEEITAHLAAAAMEEAGPVETPAGARTPRWEEPPLIGPESPRPEETPVVAERPPAAAPPSSAAPTRREEPPPAAPPTAPAPPPRPAAPPRTTVPEPDREALAAVPEHLQRRVWCLPLAIDDRAIEVAVAEPLAGAALEALRESVAPREVRLVQVHPVALDERLVEVHGLRWVAAIRRGLPKVARPEAPEEAATAHPRTTLLLPLPGGVGPAVQAATTLAALDHPRQQLEVLLLVRAHDAQGALAARTTGHRVVVAPASLPDDRTALLDLGLLLARGEHVAVLDPGDIPAPRLLAHADAALAHEGVAAARTHPPDATPTTPTTPPAPRRRGLRRAPAAPPPAPLPTTGLVARRDVLDAVGGWRDLAAKLHAAQLRVVTLDDAVAHAAAERS